MVTRKKFFSNTAMLYIMSAAQHIFPLFTFPYLTRVLEPSLYGVITYMTAVTSYVRIFTNYGFGLSSTKLIAQSRNDTARVGAVLGTTLQASAFLEFVSLVVYSVLVFAIPIMRENMLLAYLYLLGVVLEIFLPDFLFLGLEKMSSITTRYLVAKSVSTLLTFVFVRSKADILWVPLLNIAGTLIAASLIWYQITVKLKIRLSFSRWKETFALLKESSVYFFSSFATTAFGVTNTLLIGLFAPADQVAFWGVSYNLINSATSLYKPITNSLYPHMITKKDTKLIRWLLFGILPVIIAVTAVVFGFSKEVITVFCGAKYLKAVPVFKALLPVLIFSFPVMVIGFPVLGAFGMVRQTTRSTVIAAVFHIAGLGLLLAFGWFNVFNIAILRSGTEAVLLGARSYFLLGYLRKRRKPAPT